MPTSWFYEVIGKISDSVAPIAPPAHAAQAFGYGTPPPVYTHPGPYNYPPHGPLGPVIPAAPPVPTFGPNRAPPPPPPAPIRSAAPSVLPPPPARAPARAYQKNEPLPQFELL